MSGQKRRSHGGWEAVRACVDLVGLLSNSCHSGDTKGRRAGHGRACRMMGRGTNQAAPDTGSAQDQRLKIDF